MSIKVIINGVHGKMGRVTKDYLQQQTQIEVVGALGRQDDLKANILNTSPDVVIDFTTPQSVFENTKTIIETGVRPVIGTSGLAPYQIKILQQICEQKKLGGIIAPNFSLAAILMMKFSEYAAKYFPDAEIIEMHHPHKLDAPSGTALKTAEMMTQARESQHIVTNEARAPTMDEFSNVLARGYQKNDIHIHSVRLPGLFAHQMVMFGGNGETLTIRHDATDRQSMMPGILLACEKVMALDNLIYGLDKIL